MDYYLAPLKSEISDKNVVMQRPMRPSTIFNRESQSHFPMEKLFRKCMASSAHLFPAAWDEDT